jgi:hypothetical protein
MRAKHINLTHLIFHFCPNITFSSKSIMQFRRHNVRWELQTDRQTRPHKEIILRTFRKEGTKSLNLLLPNLSRRIIDTFTSDSDWIKVLNWK